MLPPCYNVAAAVMTTNLLSRQEGREETKPFFLLFKKIFFVILLLCNVVFILYSKVNQLYMYIYPLFFGFPSHLLLFSH